MLRSKPGVTDFTSIAVKMRLMKHNQMRALSIMVTRPKRDSNCKLFLIWVFESVAEEFWDCEGKIMLIKD
jgi:hypothetical protein